MEKVASKILKKVLKGFIESCSDWGTGNDVEITPSQGIITLHDICFIKDVFREMVMLPSQVELTRAECSSIDVIVPWTHLYSKPIVLKLGTVTLEAHDTVINTTTVLNAKEDVKQKANQKKQANPKDKEKKVKEKKSRELMDTILAEVKQFNLSLKIGESTLLLTIEGGETYFADDKFNKINKICNEKAIHGLIYSYRFLQVESLTMNLQTNDQIFNICNRMEITGKITTIREESKYRLIDTSVRVDLSNITLNLTMDNYINLVTYMNNLINIATESAVIDTVTDTFESTDNSTANSTVTSGATTPDRAHTPPMNIERNAFGKGSAIGRKKTINKPSLLNELQDIPLNESISSNTCIGENNGNYELNRANSMSTQSTLLQRRSNSGVGRKLGQTTSQASHMSKMRSNSTTRDATDELQLEMIGDKKLQKQLMKEEKKLQKIEKRGEPKTEFKFVLPFIKLSLKNEDINEGICWLITDFSILFIPAYGGRIKNGEYTINVGNVESIYTSGDVVKRLLWGLPKDDTKMVFESSMKTTWERNSLIKTELTGQLNFVGVTLEFEMLKKLIEFIKVTVIDRLSQMTVDVLSLRETIENSIAMAKDKFNQSLNILGLTSLIDLLKRIYSEFRLNGCKFEGPFPNHSGDFSISVDDVIISNDPLWDNLDYIIERTEKKINKKMYIKPMEKQRSIKFNIVLGSMAIEFINGDETSYLFPPTKGDFRMEIKFDDVNDSEPVLILALLEFKNMEFNLRGDKYVNIYDYFNQIKTYVKSKMGNEVVDLGSKMKDNVNNNLEQIEKDTMEFIDNSFIPSFDKTDLPTVIVNVSLDEGRLALPVTTIVNRKNINKDDLNQVSKGMTKGFKLCFAMDKEYTTLGAFLEKIETKKLEKILTPFNGIYPKNNSEWLSSEDDPSVKFIWKYDKRIKKDQRIMGVELSLFNVKVMLNSLFGVQLEQALNMQIDDEEKKKEEEKKEQEKKEEKKEETKEEIEKREEEEKKKKEKTQQLIDWVEKRYKGMTVKVNISECELFAEDHLHKATISSASPYGKQAEGIVNDLNKQLNELQERNDQLLEMKRKLQSELSDYEAKELLSQTKHSKK